MEFSNEEYYDMLLLYGECRQNANAAAREYAIRYPHRRRPSVHVFLRLLNRARYTGQLSLNRQGIGGVDRVARNIQSEEIVLQTFENNPQKSIRVAAQELNLSKSSVHRILKDNTKHAYHYTRVQDLLPGDYAARIEFCTWLLEQQENNNNFVSKILFTDESNFSREGMFNTHNYHFWAEENPHIISRRTFQTKFSRNLWAGIIGNSLIGPFELPPRLDGQIYANFVNNDLPELLEDVPLHVRQNMFFQHDGAPAHFSIRARQILNQKYPNAWIGRGGPINWPARSPDLNPLDFFLWGHMKEIIYRESIENNAELEERILMSLGYITEDMIEKACKNVIKRARLCIVVNGGHFEHLL